MASPVRTAGVRTQPPGEFYLTGVPNVHTVLSFFNTYRYVAFLLPFLSKDIGDARRRISPYTALPEPNTKSQAVVLVRDRLCRCLDLRSSTPPRNLNAFLTRLPLPFPSRLWAALVSGRRPLQRRGMQSDRPWQSSSGLQNGFRCRPKTVPESTLSC